MRPAADLAGPAMPLHLERIDWMPSPPIAPDDGPIDVGHLKRMTLGDARLTREVLTMFVSQTARLLEALAPEPARGGELAHTLKGSARAIGAFGVAEAAEKLESAVQAGGDGADALAALTHAVNEAHVAIEGMLRRS
jgi:HPt (histidine-containing phosphotransfer) domain-containing protein